MQARSRPHAPRDARARALVGLSLHPQTSYWEGEANEMGAINPTLIIVNSAAP
jgi:hypothetical protein